MEDGSGLSEMFTVSERLAYPPELVFQALATHEARRRWLPDLAATDPERDGPLEPGQQWTERRLVMGVQETEQVAVAEVAPNRKVVFLVDGDAGTARRGQYRYSWVMEPADDGSLVRVTCAAGALGRMGKLVGRFLVDPFMRAARADLTALARHLEGRATYPDDPAGP